MTINNTKTNNNSLPATKKPDPPTVNPVNTPTKVTSPVTGQSQMPAMAIGIVIGVVVVALAAVFVYINRQRLGKSLNFV